jgi:hypothetical protein
MAITKTIEIDVNSQGAVSGIDNVSKSIEQTDKATQSLRSQLRKAQADVAELSDKFGATSKEAIEAAKRAGELKDAIGDAKALTDAFNPDAKFSALSGSLAGVASGFSAVEGSLALAGVQSENLQETMVRLQAAMALSQGLQGLGESIDSFKQMGAVAKNALAGIRTGIAATGIGVLLIALGAVVAYWDDIKEAVNGVSSEQEALNEKTQANLDAEQKKLDTIGSQDNVLKLQGKSEKDILKLKIAQTDQVIKATENQIVQNDITAKAQIEAAKRNKEILKGTLEFLSIPFQAVLKTIDSIGSAIGKDFGLSAGFSKILDKGAGLIFDPEAETKKAEETRQASLKAIEKLKNDRAGLQLSINGIDKQAYETRKALKDKEFQEDLDRLNKQSEIVKSGLEKSKENQNLELQNLKDFGVKKLEETQLTLDQQLAQKKLFDEQEIAFQKAKDEAIASSKANLNNIISGLEDTGIAKTKAGQAVSKAIALTQIGIDSAVAISKASTLANAEGVAAQLAFPLVPGIGTVARVVSYASTALSVVSNIARAKKLLSSGGASAGGSSSGGGGSSAPSGGGSSAPAPQFNVVGNSGVNQIAATLGQQQPVQAYVVANQVTTQQSLDRNIVQNASLG